MGIVTIYGLSATAAEKADYLNFYLPGNEKILTEGDSCRDNIYTSALSAEDYLTIKLRNPNVYTEDFYTLGSV